MYDGKAAQEVARFVICGFYTERDIEGVLETFHDDITWIGPCDHEFFYGMEDIRAYFQAGINEVPSCQVDFTELKTVKEDETCAIVMGRFIVQTNMEDGMILKVVQRCSVYLIRDNDRWLVQHLHTSNIYEEMHEDIFFPKTVGQQTMEYMNQLLQEKIEVIDMVSDNINGGLKGSNDDATYSFFYVSDGICQMLGYTHEEFMEMSSGCALGAVYPPDREAALKSCADCFAKGLTYHAEYRIRKKDGSLIWVLDSGKKSIAKDGTVKINSMIIDITDMKQTQIDLQVERERYRIALENITDVMFEYDCVHDTLVKYERENYDHTRPLEKVLIETYFMYLEEAQNIHLDDIGLLKGYLLGEIAEDIQIRRMSVSGSWKWMKVTGTHIYDEQHQLVKCIGIWRDITEEKMKMDSLINLSKRDALTHLYNLKSVEAMIQENLKNGGHAGLLILDIDNFKQVNDTYGHLKGNDILLSVTKIVSMCTKDCDIVARIGGDEFLIYMDTQHATKLMDCAKQILMQAAEISLDTYQLTLSVGVAFQEATDTYTSLFAKADEAMYQSKRNGRNRIHQFEA